MNQILKKTSPYLLILLGLFLLLWMGQAPTAGVCLVIGIVMIIEKIWPEEWEADKKKELKL